MNKRTFKFSIDSNAKPIIEMSPEGVYVWFKKGASAAKTIIRNQWPLIALDIDADGEVIGLEVMPIPSRFSMQDMGKQAGLVIPQRVAARAQIEQVAALHMASAC